MLFTIGSTVSFSRTFLSVSSKHIHIPVITKGLTCAYQPASAIATLVTSIFTLLLSRHFHFVQIEGESAEIKENIAGLYVLFLGRILYGFGIAFTMHAVPSYISEFSPASLRGTLGGMIEIAATVGIIYAYAIGQWLTYEFPYGFSWKYTFKFATIFGILMFFGMLYLPDSPRWLVSSGRPLYEALEAAQFVNPSITSDDIVALKKDIERQIPSTTESVTSRLFCSPSLRVPMLVGVGIISAQQLTGLPGMLYYLVDIMKEVAGDQYKIALIVFAATKLLSSIIVMLYLDTWGRRTPLIAGLVIMFFSAGTLFMLFYDSLQKDSGYEVGFIALLCTFVTGYEFSVGSVSFVLMGEIFPGDVKGDAIAVAFTFNFFLAAGMAFMLYWEINDLSFTIVWAQLSLTSFVFIFFAASLVPETKGKTLEEIQKEFQQEFEVPDFLAAVDYLSGGEEGSGAESAARAVGDMRAAAAAGAAYIFQYGDNVAGDGDNEQNALLQNRDAL